MTHYRRHQRQAPFDRPPIESVEAKLERIAGDPFATFGPPRADRPAFLTQDEKDEVVRSAQNWLRLGQRVQIIDGPCAIDPTYGGYQFIGREGVIFKPCGAVFPEWTYVFLDPVGGERVEKVPLVEIRDLKPLGL